MLEWFVDHYKRHGCCRRQPSNMHIPYSNLTLRNHTKTTIFHMLAPFHTEVFTNIHSFKWFQLHAAMVLKNCHQKDTDIEVLYPTEQQATTKQTMTLTRTE